MRRGARFPQWWMLLVAILSILSGQGSLVGMERFAKRHRQTLNELLGTDFGKSLGVAIAQTTYATDASSEIQALRQLLEKVELDGILVQADALHANRPFSSTSPSVAPTS